jgi:hypothetical protein
MTPGWSAMGGQTHSAYDTERAPGEGLGAVLHASAVKKKLRLLTLHSHVGVLLLVRVSACQLDSLPFPRDTNWRFIDLSSKQGGSLFHAAYADNCV